MHYIRVRILLPSPPLDGGVDSEAGGGGAAIGRVDEISHPVPVQSVTIMH